MFVSKHLPKWLALCLVLVCTSGLEAKNKKGAALHKEGQAAEARQKWDDALNLYEQALATDPTDVSYVMGVRRVRFQAGMYHVNLGQKLRAQGKLEEALAEFQKAYATDPSSLVAETEIKRTTQMIQREKQKGSGGHAATAPDQRGLTPMQVIRKESDELIASEQGPPELKPISRAAINLKMTNQPVRVLYETVGKIAGVNVVMDSDFQPTGKQNFSIDLTNTTLEGALDTLSVLTKTFWKPLSTNTIFVTNENVTKRRDYEDFVVKTFYLQNVTTVQELQEIATAVRALTDIRRLFTYNAQNAIIARGSVDQINLLEKLIADLDKPKSEVVVDVIVMEANRAKTLNLTSTLTSGGNPGINLPITFTPRNPVLFGSGTSSTTSGTATDTTTTTGTSNYGVSLARLGHISTNDYSVTLPNALLNLVMNDRQTRILQNPQLRAVDSVKCSLRIGDKYPYATGSFNSGFGGAVGGGISPLVSTQFQFAEVGVNVDLVAKIHSPEEVSLHVELEVSSVRDKVTLGGLDQPVIGQRKFTHDIRLKEGEVAMLGGLVQGQRSKTSSGVPGLAGIPGLGMFFGSNNREEDRGELLVALVPHIVRAPDIQPINTKSVLAGLDQLIKLSYAPATAEAPAQPGATAAPAPAEPAAPPVTPPQPVTPPATAPTPASQARLTFNPPALSLSSVGTTTITLQVENATDIFTAPMKLRFDPKVVQVRDAAAGTLLTGDGQKVNFSKNILNDQGQVDIVLNRLPGSGGISGSGALVTITLQAVGRGISQLQVQEIGLKNSQLQPITVAVPAAAISVP